MAENENVRDIIFALDFVAYKKLLVIFQVSYKLTTPKDDREKKYLKFGYIYYVQLL